MAYTSALGAPHVLGPRRPAAAAAAAALLLLLGDDRAQAPGARVPPAFSVFVAFHAGNWSAAAATITRCRVRVVYRDGRLRVRRLRP